MATLRQVYRDKRDTLLDAQAESLTGPGTTWTRPDGGLYVWLSFPPEIETGPESPLMRAALNEGVLYVPGQFCYVNGANGAVPKNEARLSFGVAAPDEIREAVSRLARARAVNPKSEARNPKQIRKSKSKTRRRVQLARTSGG